MTHPTPTHPPTPSVPGQPKEAAMTILAAPPKPVDPVYPTSPPGPGPLPRPHKWAMGQPNPGTESVPTPLPPMKPSVWRHVADHLILTAACTATTIGAASIMTALLGWSPLDFTSWLIAFIAIAGLAMSRMPIGPKRPARPVRRATRAACHSLAAPPWSGVRGLPSAQTPVRA